MIVKGGDTNITTYFALRLAADGTAATGLTITGIDLQYVRSGAAPSAKVDATALAATDSAHGDNQAIEIDATDQPGLYRVDWPDAAFAAGVREVVLTVKVATAFTEHLRVEIDPFSVVWDEVLTGATHNVVNSAGRRLRQLQETGGYQGAIWVDTVNGTTGETTSYENGTDTNPVGNMADANTMATALTISRFMIAPGSTIPLAAAQNNQTFNGWNWTLALGGQDIAGSTFFGATVSGIAAGTGTTQAFSHCLMNACSHIKGTHILESAIAGTQTVVEAGDFFFDRCHSAVAGTSTWSFDFGAAIGNTNLNVRGYSGGIQLESMGDTGTDTASIEGNGQIIEGTCAGGTVASRGNFTVSGITNLTLSDDARIDVAQINAQADTAISDAFTFTGTSVQADMTHISGDTGAADKLEEGATALVVTAVNDAGASTTAFITDLTEATDDHYNGRIVTFTTGALAGQSSDITDYAGATKTITVTALTEAPGNNDEFVIS